jgi:hypothetical protein
LGYWTTSSGLPTAVCEPPTPICPPLQHPRRRSNPREIVRPRSCGHAPRNPVGRDCTCRAWTRAIKTAPAVAKKTTAKRAVGKRGATTKVPQASNRPRGATVARRYENRTGEHCPWLRTETPQDDSERQGQTGLVQACLAEMAELSEPIINPANKATSRYVHRPVVDQPSDAMFGTC